MKLKLILSSIFPNVLKVDELGFSKGNDLVFIRELNDVTILIGGLSNFEKYSQNESPKNVVIMLNKYLSEFKATCKKLNIQHIRSIEAKFVAFSGNYEEEIETEYEGKKKIKTSLRKENKYTLRCLTLGLSMIMGNKQINKLYNFENEFKVGVSFHEKFFLNVFGSLDEIINFSVYHQLEEAINLQKDANINCMNVSEEVYGRSCKSFDYDKKCGKDNGFQLRLGEYPMNYVNNVSILQLLNEIACDSYYIPDNWVEEIEESNVSKFSVGDVRVAKSSVNKFDEDSDPKIEKPEIIQLSFPKNGVISKSGLIYPLFLFTAVKKNISMYISKYVDNPIDMLIYIVTNLLLLISLIPFCSDGNFYSSFAIIVYSTIVFCLLSVVLWIVLSFVMNKFLVSSCCLVVMVIIQSLWILMLIYSYKESVLEFVLFEYVSFIGFISLYSTRFHIYFKFIIFVTISVLKYYMYIDSVYVVNEVVLFCSFFLSVTVEEYTGIIYFQKNFEIDKNEKTILRLKRKNVGLLTNFCPIALTKKITRQKGVLIPNQEIIAFESLLDSSICCIEIEFGDIFNREPLKLMTFISTFLITIESMIIDMSMQPVKSFDQIFIFFTKSNNVIEMVKVAQHCKNHFIDSLRKSNLEINNSDEINIKIGINVGIINLGLILARGKLDIKIYGRNYNIARSLCINGDKNSINVLNSLFCLLKNDKNIQIIKKKDDIKVSKVENTCSICYN